MTDSNGEPSSGDLAAGLLDVALEQLRLEGALFFRSELSEPFTFESAPLALADSLHPGAQRLILFHIVATGACWVRVQDGDRHWARQGDVIVLPYGDHHLIGGEKAAECVSILALIDPLPWDVMPRLRHGGGGARTDLVCGYLYSDDPLFDPAMRALPSVFVVRLTADAATWVHASISYSLQEAAPPTNNSPNPIATRLPELVLIEVLRAHLATAPAVNHGWIAALSDPVLAPALALLHNTPTHRWTVADLASAVAVSRSLLDARFREILGRPPIRYLTQWRMHLAERLLATTDLTVFTVARRVGYDSEEAFSRAFKREHRQSPGHWRAAHNRTAAQNEPPKVQWPATSTPYPADQAANIRRSVVA
jgi:AraC-like DNA-binding protein